MPFTLFSDNRGRKFFETKPLIVTDCSTNLRFADTAPAAEFSERDWRDQQLTETQNFYPSYKSSYHLPDYDHENANVVFCAPPDKLNDSESRATLATKQYKLC